jgi:hypothetical protein
MPRDNIIPLHRGATTARPQEGFPLTPPANLYDSFAETLQREPAPCTFRDYLAGWVESRVFVFFAGAYVGVFLTLVSAVVAS